jgi:hypothetical protein
MTGTIFEPESRSSAVPPILRIFLRSRVRLPWRKLFGGRSPGSLPAAGRAHQRQAHRGDRTSDDASGESVIPISGIRISSWRNRLIRSFSKRATEAIVAEKGGQAGCCRAVDSGYHQGIVEHGQLHLGRLLPGDYQGADRRQSIAGAVDPARPQGKCDHGPDHPRRNRLCPQYRDLQPWNGLRMINDP